MTIDIDELRFSAANSVRDLALMPSEVLELLDLLEAAEKEIALKERVIDALGSELNAVAKENTALRAKIAEVEKQESDGSTIQTAARILNIDLIRQCVALQAKIAEMEKQEPVAWMSSRNGFICKENKNPDYNVPLYGLPGAQGEEK